MTICTLLYDVVDVQCARLHENFIAVHCCGGLLAPIVKHALHIHTLIFLKFSLNENEIVWKSKLFAACSTQHTKAYSFEHIIPAASCELNKRSEIPMQSQAT